MFGAAVRSGKAAMRLTRPDDTDYQAMLDGEAGVVEPHPQQASIIRRNDAAAAAAASSAGGPADPAAADGAGADKGRKSKLYSVAGYIIVTEFCERLAYYGFSGSPRLVLCLFARGDMAHNTHFSSLSFSRALLARGCDSRLETRDHQGGSVVLSGYCS